MAYNKKALAYRFCKRYINPVVPILLCFQIGHKPPKAKPVTAATGTGFYQIKLTGV